MDASLLSARADRGSYRHFLTIPTRWMDNDVYGHVNNVVYYSYFDTVINDYLTRLNGHDMVGGPVIHVTAETMCRYRKSVSFPQVLSAGLRVGRLGSSSVRYEMSLFVEDQAEPAASGHVIDVFVDRETMRPVQIPQTIRGSLERLLVE